MGYVDRQNTEIGAMKNTTVPRTKPLMEKTTRYEKECGFLWECPSFRKALSAVQSQVTFTTKKDPGTRGTVQKPSARSGW